MSNAMLSSQRRYLDLWGLLGLAIALGVTLYFPYLTILRPVAAFLVLFFGSGYALLAALYPDLKSFNPWLRLTGSFGLSLITSGMLLLLVSLTIGVTEVNSYLALLGWISMMSFIAWRRRAALPVPTAVPTHPGRARVRWNERSGTGKALFIAQGIAVGLLLLSGARLLWVSAQTGPQFSEVYLLGADGKAAGYPSHVDAGSSINVEVGISNHESQAVEYGLAYRIDDGPTQFLRSVQLQPGEVWQAPVGIQVPDSTGLHKINFLFWNVEGGQVYDTLHIWVSAE